MCHKCVRNMSEICVTNVSEICVTICDLEIQEMQNCIFLSIIIDQYSFPSIHNYCGCFSISVQIDMQPSLAFYNFFAKKHFTYIQVQLCALVHEYFIYFSNNVLVHYHYRKLSAFIFISSITLVQSHNSAILMKHYFCCVDVKQ